MRGALWPCFAASLALACGPSLGKSGAAGGSGDGSEGDEPIDPIACSDPEVLIQPGPAQLPSGMERCADGFVHRTSALACDADGFGEGDCENPFGSDGACMSDAECVADDGAVGVCLATAEPWAGCECNFGCGSDADCGPDQACYCAGSHSRCIPATCRTDDDCAGGLCGLSTTIGACGSVTRRLSCTSEQDECRVDASCDDCLQCLSGLEGGTWTCSGSTGICGPCG